MVRKAAAIALVASALPILPAAASGDAIVNTVQSPPNPVPFGQDVTLTITVTNTGPRAFPSGIEADTVLSLFVLRAQSDRVAPNTYTSVTGANGQACVPTAAKVPFVDCALSGFPAGATTTFTAVINAQVSVDHSVVQELLDSGEIDAAAAAVHPERHVITRALGGPVLREPDFFLLPLESASRVVLCSDGVSGMIDDQEIEEILATAPDPRDAAERIVAAAVAAGGQDNATAVVVDVVGWAESGEAHETRAAPVSLEEKLGALP